MEPQTCVQCGTELGSDEGRLCWCCHEDANEPECLPTPESVAKE